MLPVNFRTSSLPIGKTLMLYRYPLAGDFWVPARLSVTAGSMPRRGYLLVEVNIQKGMVRRRCYLYILGHLPHL